MELQIREVYFRRLSLLYSGELQLISFFPELQECASMVGPARRRRDILELLAATHVIASAGNECRSVRKLIEGSRVKLAASSGASRQRAVCEICASIHRLLVLKYEVARSFASRLGLSSDVTRIDEILSLLKQSPPPAATHTAARQIEAVFV